MRWGFCHVMAYTFLFEMPQNREFSFSVLFLFENWSRTLTTSCQTGKGLKIDFRTFQIKMHIICSICYHIAKSSIPNSYFNFIDRSLSEDLFGDDDLEAFLLDLERRTEGRIDVRSIWDYISSRSELNCSLQFTKLYEPINSEQFLVDQTKQNDNEMEQVRVSQTVQTGNCQSLYGGQSG